MCAWINLGVWGEQANKYQEIRMHFIGTNKYLDHLSFFREDEHKLHKPLNSPPQNLMKLKPNSIKNSALKEYTVKYGLSYTWKTEN